MVKSFHDELEERVKRMKPIYEPFQNQVTVVRCKDCVNSFGLTDVDGNRQLLCTEMGKRGLSENDYCSYGKRREQKHCGECAHFLGGGDFGLCCELDHGLCYESSKACYRFEVKKDG